MERHEVIHYKCMGLVKGEFHWLDRIPVYRRGPASVVVGRDEVIWAEASHTDKRHFYSGVIVPSVH